ncbi:hypothetical protein EMCRGX_G019169 [Ephydatia muelleri]
MRLKLVKRSRVVVVLLVVTLSSVFVWKLFRSFPTHKPSWAVTGGIYLSPEAPTELPIVVWWTPFTAYKRIVRDCGAGKCIFTHSRTELNNPQTQAFMFYGTALHLWNDLPLPRSPRHLWALLHEESPKNNWVLAHEDGIRLFNLTATCSRYSDFPLVTQYLETLEKLTRPASVPTSQKSKGDMGLVIYLHSDCDPPSDRDTYVQELMKYVKVDSYGRCLHNKDLPDHLRNQMTFSSEEIYKLQAKYKFSISFENAICEDYITEKFWRPLVAGSVPIVRGSPTILDWAPDVEHSVIVADHFSSPKDLAEYLLYLDQNDEEYERYLEFKKNGITNKRLLDHMTNRGWFVSLVFDINNPPKSPDFITGFECFVCNTLHKRSLQTKEGPPPPMIVANHQHYNCPIPTPSLTKKEEDVQGVMSKLPGETKGTLHFWRYTAECSKKKAKVLSETIGRGATQEELNSANDRACRDLYF